MFLVPVLTDFYSKSLFYYANKFKAILYFTFNQVQGTYFILPSGSGYLFLWQGLWCTWCWVFVESVWIFVHTTIHSDQYHLLKMLCIFPGLIVPILKNESSITLIPKLDKDITNKQRKQKQKKGKVSIGQYLY